MYLNCIKLTTLSCAIAISLAACGGSDSSSETTTNIHKTQANQTDSSSSTTQEVVISGKAATGKALKGIIEAVSADGQKSAQVQIGSSGYYKLSIIGDGPYLIKATSSDLRNEDGTPLTLFSYSALGGTANVTELTTYALYGVSDKGNLNTIYDNWQSHAKYFPADKVETYGKNTIIDFRDEFKAAGVTEAPNIFTTDFETNGEGLDKVLDILELHYTCSSISSCTVLGKTNGAVISGATYSDEKSDKIINDFFIDNSNTNVPNLGHDTAVIKSITRFDNVTSQAEGNFEVNGMTKPSSQSEFCDDSDKYIENTLGEGYTYDVTECSFDGTTGIIKTQVTLSQYGTSFKQYNDYYITFK